MDRPTYSQLRWHSPNAIAAFLPVSPSRSILGGAGIHYCNDCLEFGFRPGPSHLRCSELLSLNSRSRLPLRESFRRL
jgi:hypothetical protein